MLLSADSLPNAAGAGKLLAPAGLPQEYWGLSHLRSHWLIPSLHWQEAGTHNQSQELNPGILESNQEANTYPSSSCVCTVQQYKSILVVLTMLTNQHPASRNMTGWNVSSKWNLIAGVCSFWLTALSLTSPGSGPGPGVPLPLKTKYCSTICICHVLKRFKHFYHWKHRDTGNQRALLTSD